MVDLNLKREPSFNTFIKTELTSLFGSNDESMMLETPKGGQKQGFFSEQPSRHDPFDQAAIIDTVLQRTDSRDCFGQPLTRSKSKECLTLVNEHAAAIMSNQMGGGTGSQNGEPTRLTRSRSQEAMARNNTDLTRADSILGNIGFDLSDLLQGDLATTVAEPAPAAQPARAQKRKSSSTNQSAGKKARGSKSAAPEEVSDPAHDPWIHQNVRLTRGKYEGRMAYVLGKTEKKYQVQVEGVAYQLEFYGSMFVRPEDYKPAQPKRSRKKAVTDDRQISFGLTPSMNDISDTVHKS